MTDAALERRVSKRRLSGIRREIEAQLPDRKFGREITDPLWRLVSFALREDRQEAPFFVGREDVIEEVERLCEDTCHLAASGERVFEGATRVLQGAPGAARPRSCRN